MPMATVTVQFQQAPPMQNSKPFRRRTSALQEKFIPTRMLMAIRALSNGTSYDGSGNMDFGTASVGQGGTSGRINFTIAQTGITGAGGTTEMVISSFGVTISTSLTVASSMTIVAPTSIPYSLLVTTSATPSTFFHVAISTNGHILSNGPAPTISACGAGPNGSVVGDDTQGTISIGGGSVTGCTLTFANNFGSGCTVNCTTSDSITTSTPDVVTTSTTMTLGFSASIGGGKVLYHCTGYGATCK